MSGMGMIAGALGGGAAAVQGMAQSYIAEEQKGNLMQLQADIDEQKAQRIDEYRRRADDADRKSRADDVNTRAGIIGRQTQADRVNTWAEKHQADNGPNVPTDNTGENLDPTLRELVPLSDSDRQDARQRAMAEGGYLKPSEEVAANSRASTLEARQSALEKQLAYRGQNDNANRESRDKDRASHEKIEADRLASTADIAQKRIDADLAKVNMKSGKAVNEKLNTTKAAAKDFIKVLTDAGPGRTPAERAKWQAQMDVEYEIIKKVDDQLNRKLDGADAPEPAPAPKASPTNSGGGKVGASSGGASGVTSLIQRWNAAKKP